MKASDQSTVKSTLELNRPYVALLWAALLMMLILSILLARQQLTPGESLFSLRNGVGPVVKSIVQQHQFGLVDGNYGWRCYACRMPVVPLLGAASYWLSPRAIVFLVIKNMLLWSLSIWACFRLKQHYNIKPKWLSMSALILLISPYTLSTAGQIEVEEGFLFAFVLSMFCLLITVDSPLSALALGLSISAVYLTKSSMMLACMTAAAWLILKHRNRMLSMTAIPLATLSIAILGWGVYTYAVSGVFAVGSDSSSWNGWNFYKGNNSYAEALYPRISLDALDHEQLINRLLPTTPVRNELDLSHAQMALGRAFLHEKPTLFVKMELKKLVVACCDLGESPERAAGRPRPVVMWSNLVSHVTLGCVVVIALMNLRRRRISEAEALALLLAIAIVVPYLGGFLYMRHLIPIYFLMTLTLAVQSSRWKPRSFAD